MLKSFYRIIVRYRILVFAAFIAAAAAGALMRPLVGVNYDMKDYLPEDSPSTRGLVVMQEEFGGSMPNCRVMVKDVTYEEALDYKHKIEEVDGVESVMWLDDQLFLPGAPPSFAGKDALDTYFRIYGENDYASETSGKEPENDPVGTAAADEAGQAGTADSADDAADAGGNGGEAGETLEQAVDNGDARGSALMVVTIDKNRRLSAVADIRKVIGDENCMTGDAVSTAAATEQTVVEIRKVAMASVLLVLLILILTTRSWLDPIIILAGIGVAVMINNGTNLIFGEISFVTNASGSILQLAVSLDYSVFLIHRFEECRRELAGNAAVPDAPAGGLSSEADMSSSGKQSSSADHGEHAHGVLDIRAAEEAMADALAKSTGPIASSGLTTVIGFIVLILMRYKIGPDMGLALAKGVAISLITVFTFTPAMILILFRLTERTRHKDLLPDFTVVGKIVRKVMIPAVAVFVIIVVPSFLVSHQGSFYYGASHIFGPDTRVGRDTTEINEAFGTSDTYAVIVPKDDPAREKELTRALKEYPEIKGIRSYGEILGVIPPDIIPGGISELLVSDDHSRLVLTVSAEYEGSKTFALVQSLRSTCESIYGDEYYLVGEGVSTYDLMDTITSDMMKINLSAVLAIYIILVLMFRKLFLPVVLVASIETAIWINLAFPTLMGQPVFYIAYLIISSVQLGATVDYAILLTDRYRENRADGALDSGEAVVETVKSVTASILTSGSALIIVGFLMGALSTHGILAQLGIFIGRGAICSLVIVFFVLPGLLYLYSRFLAERLRVL